MDNEKYSGTFDIEQEFSVPVEQVYTAWTSEDALKQWWHPFQKGLKTVKNNLSPGGLVEYDFGDDRKCEIKGEYKEVVENSRLVYSWNWDLDHDEMTNGEYMLTVDF